MLIGNTCYPSVLHQNRLWIHTTDFVKSCINIVMRAVFVNNIKKHFDYSEILIIFATVNQNILIMQTFIVVKSQESQRYHIYDNLGNCVAVAKSISAVYKYFEAVIATSDYPQFFQRFTAVDNTWIVILK